MTADKFRAIALSFEGAEEVGHMGHPDFRVGGKIFATLDATGERGMVKVTPETQEFLVSSEPEVYVPCPGAWGRQGCTFVVLKKAKTGPTKLAVSAAFENVTAKRSGRPGRRA